MLSRPFTKTELMNTKICNIDLNGSQQQSIGWERQARVGEVENGVHLCAIGEEESSAREWRQEVT